MKSPFRRRPKRLKTKGKAPAKPVAKEPEVVDWPTDGTGRNSLMSTIRGDAESGAGFGAGLFGELHAAFSGAKKIQLEEQEQEKLRRVDDHEQTGRGNPQLRDDLESGKIRIRRPQENHENPESTD